jgi:hypothetical protein
MSTGPPCAARRDSFCAYIRTSASCNAEEGSAASPGITAEPQEAPTSTPVAGRQRFRGAAGCSVEAVLLAGQKQAELVAADPVGDTVFAGRLPQGASQSDQELVARGCPKVSL